MILPASYANGFAPRDGQPLYPSLWRGCVGAWNPGLGPSGLTLRDWSGFGDHGTLTNMDAGSDWIVNSGRYALDFDGTNDHTVHSTSIKLSGAFTVSWWENITTANLFNTICAFRTSASSAFIVYRNTNFLYQYLAFRDSTSVATNGFRATGASNPSTVVGTWRHFAITGQNVSGASSTGFSVYENGVSLAVTDCATFAAGTFVNSWARDGLGTFSATKFDDMLIHSRALSAAEIRLLASRRGIAYELAPRRRSSVAVAGGGFKAAWIPRRSLIVGGGTN